MFKTIPKNECPLNFIANMEEETENARFYLGKNAVEKLRSTADFQNYRGAYERLFWEETDECYSALIKIIPVCEDFFLIAEITADEIDFKKNPKSPEYIFFLEMEE